MLLRDAQAAHAGDRARVVPAAVEGIPPRSPSPWRGPEAAWRAAWAAGSVALAVVALWVLYVIAANVVLLAGMPKRWFLEPPDVQTLEYESAWTLWPGTVHLRGAEVASLEGPVWMVSLDSAEVDIDLAALTHKRFHATRLVGDGVVVRVRTVLEPGAWEGRRAHAMPPIHGYSDAQRVMLPEEPDGGEDYDRWVIDIAGVDVRVRELWIQEYFYRGGLHARGAFYIAPGRAVRVGPAEVEIQGGELSVAGKQLASSIRGDVDVELSTFDPRGVGREVLRHLSGRLRSSAEIPSMEWTDFYLADRPLSLADGSGTLDWDVSVSSGVLLQGTWLRARTERLDVRTKKVTVVGANDMLVDVPEDGQLRVTGHAPLTQLFRAGVDLPPPTIERGRLVIRMPGDLAGPMDDIRADLDFASAVVPDLRWVHDPEEPPTATAPRMIGGRATLSGGIHIEPDGKASGDTRVRFDKARVMWSGVELRGWSEGVVTAREANVGTGRLVMSSHVESRDVSVHHGDDVYPGWWASTDIDRLELEMDPLSLHMAMRSKARDGRPALEILNARGSVPGWIKGLVASHGVSAQGDLRIAPGKMDFSLMRARSGPVAVAGRMHMVDGKKATGAFLVDGGVLSLGIELTPDDNHLRPLVGQDWLDQKLGVRRKTVSTSDD